MATAFSDADDKQLVQLAKRYEDAGRRVAWAEVARTMRRTRRAPNELRRRLEALKRTYGLDLSKFPRCFFGRPVRRQPRHPPRVRDAQGSREALQPDPSEDDVAFSLGSQVYLDLDVPDANQYGPHYIPDPLSDFIMVEDEAALPSEQRADTPKNAATADEANIMGEQFELDHAERALAKLFGRVTAADVRAPLHTPHYNAGEVLPSSIEAILHCIGGIDKSDTFLDIGAGLGNVLVQVALQTAAARRVGIEARPDVFSIGEGCVQKHIQSYPQLHRVQVVCTDVRDVVLGTVPPFCNSTVIYSNNVVFETSVNAYLQAELCHIRPARALITTLSFCSRHRRRCQAEFCQQWRLHTTLKGEGSWTSQSVPLYVYLRTN